MTTKSSGATIQQLVWEKREEIKRIAARHGAGNVRIFGSVARGEAGPESDVDLLIDVVGPTTSWFPGGLIVDLQQLLGRRVDIVTEKGLREGLRPYVMRDVVPL